MIGDLPRAELARPDHKSKITNRKSTLLAASLPYAIFVVLLGVSWNRWIEPYVDTGRELMVPWRIAHGERLYRDVQFPHGPLAPWLGAAVDAAFGRSLAARTALAAAIALLHVIALHLAARRISSAWRAALATSVAVSVAVFLRPGGWLFPFSFDCAIAVAALTWALSLTHPREGPGRDGLAGFCLLAALLSRVELGVAGVAILAIAVRREPIRLLRLAFFPLSAAAVAYGAASLGIPFERLAADGWLVVIRPPEAFRHVYRAYAGLDRIGLRSAELALALILLVLAAAVVAAAAAIAARLESRRPGAARAIEAAGVLLLAAAAALSIRPPASIQAGLALLPPLVRVVPPVVVAAGGLRLILRLLRRQPRGALAGIPDAVLWLGAVFAARVLLAAGYSGPYGSFFLPLPIVVAVAGVFALADRAAPSLGRDLPRVVGAALTLFLASRCVTVARFYRQPGWSRVSTPAGDVWLPEPAAGATRGALEHLRARVPPGGLVTGFPEAGFFDYTLGFRNPLWLEQFFPGRLDAAGEDRVIAALSARPPAALVYANVLAVGEGQRAFGADYLRRLDAAARSAFRAEAAYGPGARPGARIGDPEFFVEIRVPAGAAGAPP